MQRTPQQKNAIDAPCGNILVSAAAGSGKTSVMTERIVSRITKRELDIKNVLVMTFTDAAAKSMREKISNQLKSAIDNAKDQTDKEYLSKQLAFLSQSSISTIHSFCLDVVKSFYYEAQDNNGNLILEPGFRIEDSGEAEILLSATLDEVFDDYYKECDNNPDTIEAIDFLFLVDAYGSTRDDQSLRAMVLSFFYFLRSMPDYKMWIVKQKANLRDTISDFDNSNAFRTLKRSLIQRYERARDAIDRFDELLSSYPEIYKDKKKNAAIIEKFNEFSLFLRNAKDILEPASKISKSCINEKNAVTNVTWDDIYNYFSIMPELPEINRLTYNTDEKLHFKEIVTDYFAQLIYFTTGRYKSDFYTKNFLYPKAYVFSKNKEQTVAELEKMRPAIEKFYEIIIKLDEKYKKAKQQANIIDFSDFEHISLHILKSDNVRNYYKQKFQEIYLDEYQDTSSIQEEIIKQIATDNCFMVGDVKQSIYKFRHARPKIFMGKQDTFYPYDQGEFDKSGTLIKLNKNFRSVEGILRAVNDVFYQIMTKDSGPTESDNEEIEYNEDHYLIPHRENHPDIPFPVEIMLVDTLSLSQDDENITKDSSNSDENQDIAEGNTDENAEWQNGDDEIISVIKGISANENEEEKFSKEDAKKYEKEALCVAFKIKELIENNNANENNNADVNNTANENNNADVNNTGNDTFVIDDHIKNKKSYRPGDIAVLARTRNLCAIFADAIKSLGIQVEQEKITPFMERYELKVMEAFLKLLDNPMQDIPLVSVMKSDLFDNSFSEDELLEIRIFSLKSKYFYDCCKIYSQNAPDCLLKEKLLNFYSWLLGYRNKLTSLSIGEIIEDVYTKTALLSLCHAKPFGKQRVEALLQFQEWARSYENTRQNGLYSFISYMDSIHDKSNEKSPFGIEQSLSDSVKVMTTHKSKGLEYKVVFLVGNDRAITPKDTKDAIIKSEECGVGFLYVDVENQYKYPTPLTFAMREEMRNAELAEEMRLLYVGMTRAEDRLFITGTCDSFVLSQDKGHAGIIKKIRENPVVGGLPKHLVLGAKSTMEWIMMALAKNRHVDLKALGIFNENSINSQTIVLNDKKENSKTYPCEYDGWKVSVVNYYAVKKQIDNYPNSSENHKSNFDGKSDEEKALLSNDDKKVISSNLNENSFSKFATPQFCEIAGFDTIGRQYKPQESVEKEIEHQDLIKKLDEKFSYKYPYEPLTRAPLKVSVSEIKRREQEEIQNRESEFIGYNESEIIAKFDGETVFNESKNNSSLMSINEKANDAKSENADLSITQLNNPNKISLYRSINTSLKSLDSTISSKIDRREIGIAVHSFFRFLDYEPMMDNPTNEKVLDHLSNMLEIGILSNKEYPYVKEYSDRFCKFLESSLAKRISMAVKSEKKEVYREIPFTMKLPPLISTSDTTLISSNNSNTTTKTNNNINDSMSTNMCTNTNANADMNADTNMNANMNANTNADMSTNTNNSYSNSINNKNTEKQENKNDYTLVQGMIDCWFVEDGKAVLVDYKTDRIKGNYEEIKTELTKRYKLQLDLYAKAINQIAGYEVKESIIWLVEDALEFVI